MTDPYGCQIATGRLDKDGYAFMGRTRAHIAAWTEANGPVLEGKVLDHLCRRRSCRAVIHLQPVTKSENELRKSLAYRIRKRIGCTVGHAMPDNQIMTDAGGIVCRACRDGVK